MLDQTPEDGTTSKYQNWQRWVQMSSLGLLESPSPRELEYGVLRMIGGNRIARVAGFRRRRRRTPGKLLSKPSSLPLGSDPGLSDPLPFPIRSHHVPHASTTPTQEAPSSVPHIHSYSSSRPVPGKARGCSQRCSHPLRSPSGSTVLKVIGNA